jgi:hypothetical protein
MKIDKKKDKDISYKIDSQLIQKISRAADILDTIGGKSRIQDRTFQIIYQNKALWTEARSFCFVHA